MKYEAVLFDMDGTVLDTLDDLADAVNHSLERFALPRVERERVRSALGNGAARLIKLCLPEGCPEGLEKELLEYYMAYYEDHCRIKTRPYDGVLPLMERLRSRGVKLAIISNKPDPAVKELAGAFFPGLLEAAQGESESVRRKPCPDGVLAAAGEMAVPVERCLYVGDSEVDAETGRRAGMDHVCVSWGFRSAEQLARSGAGHIVSTVRELERFIDDN